MNIKSSFETIAKNLFNKIQLNINNNYFEFLDFEFYYYSNFHRDNFTHQHAIEIGKLRGHRYGVDISLGGNLENYGGILLRGLLKNGNTRIYKTGIVNELINSLQVGSNKLEFVEKDTQETSYLRTKRKNLGNKLSENNKNYKLEKYRFIALDIEYWKLLKGKEIILKSQSELSDSLIKNILGYNLNK